MNQETLYFDERTGEMRFADVRSCRPSGRPSEAPSQPAAEPVSTPVKPRTPRGKKPKAPQGEPKPLVLQIPEQWRRFVREQLWRPAEVALQFMPSERRERWEAAVRLLARLSDGEAVPTPEVEKISQGTLHTLGPAVREVYTEMETKLLFCEVICDAAEVIHWAVRTLGTGDRRDFESFQIRVKKLAESVQGEGEG